MAKKALMLGNEAVARGAWEAGVRVVSSYPGTPSTEITENVAKYPEIHAEWAVNEKVSLEVCAGAAYGGARAMGCMKHVGLNVAADPLFTLSYTGVNGALVVVVADDPGMHSSQNEQDSRNYARGAHLPMLEPADSEECSRFTQKAFDLSERFDTPVLLRLTTRVAHARSPVTLNERREAALKPYEKNVAKYVMMPGMAIKRHVVVEARMNDLAAYADESELNVEEMRDAKIGVICSGAAYEYVREALPEVSVLKLGMVYPLPEKKIRAFAEKVETLYVVEELEPFFEEQILSWGLKVSGKNLTGRQGELSARKVAKVFGRPLAPLYEAPAAPARPPVMCAGCPHRGPFSVLGKLKLRVMGDIGCYTLGTLAPLNAMDATLCMGASVGMSQGMILAQGEDSARRTISVIGDSTFLHSGITSLINAVYNGSAATVMILDNTITGMTGHQPNPATGFDIYGNATTRISLEDLCKSCGVKRVRVVDSFDLGGIEAAVKEELLADEVSVIIARRPCALLDKKNRRAPLFVNKDACKGCFACMRLGCPAIAKGEKFAVINPEQCVGCGMCVQVCRFGAIEKAGGKA